MASGKRKSGGTDLPPQKKTRSVKTSTCDKWIADNDVSLSTSVWLKYDRGSGDRLVADSLKCSVCIQFLDKIRSTKNFSEAFIVGSKKLRTSAFKDHAATEMHSRAMSLFRKQQCGSTNPVF